MLIMSCMLISQNLFSRIDDPVRWKFTSVKVGDYYELHFSARIEEPWHIYAQDMNENVGFPTTINFYPSPLLEFEGKTQEKGDKTQKKVEGIELKYYNEKVEFIQKVKVKGNVKTNVNGKIDYMACTESHCLPPSARRFTISLE